MTRAAADTLVSCLASAPRDPARGFRFKSLDGGERFYSFAELEHEAQLRAGKLAALGLERGDRVALVIADPAEFVLSFVAAAIGGMVPVPIYPRASFKARNAYENTVAHILRAAGAKVLLATEPAREVMEEVLALDVGPVRLAMLEEAAAATPKPIVDRSVIQPDDLCFLQFTSGSTSLPKGVMVSHRNLVANARAFLGPAGADRRDDDLAVGWLPLYHDMGLIGFVLGTIICDIPTVLIPTEAFGRRPNIWLETLHQQKASITFAPNFAYALATKRARDRDIEGLDLSRMRLAGCGAEPINPRVMRDFARRFERCGFRAEALMPAYGMAEATLAITFHPLMTPLITDTVDAEAMKRGQAEKAEKPADPAAPHGTVELVCCGRIFPDHEVKIVGEHGEPLGERQVGEIWTRGPSITGGYFGNPEATAEAWTDGWLHTGDLGYLADGMLYVCGRLKDLIIIRGANHYPQDIEWAVSDVEGVRRDNVVAFSVMRDGEETLIVSAEGASTDAPQLRRAIAAKVAETSGLTVGHVAIVKIGSLPKTSSGKVQRRRTKQMFEAGQLEEHPA